MAFDVMKDFDKRMELLRNTMKKAVEAELPHLQWLRTATLEEARKRHEDKMAPLNQVFGERPIPRHDK